jgi:hypothetical protein
VFRLRGKNAARQRLSGESGLRAVQRCSTCLKES